MSNLLAALGRGQLRHLDDRIERRRRLYERYRRGLGDLPGVSFMPEAPWGESNRWLTCVTFDPHEFGADREVVRLALEEQDIEARPLWKPLHLQPLFEGCTVTGGEVAEGLFATGLCLPSGSALQPEAQDRVMAVIRDIARTP
jgi:dTDP-4-amino-4,6-dideoxygalactose transaminase